MIVKKEPERISSGIEGFDPLLGGGYPKGSIIVYYGPPGTGKTICSFYFALAGVQEGERVLYVTFEEGEKSLVQLANNLGVDLQKYIDADQFVIRDFSRLVSEYRFETSLAQKIKEGQVTRVVVDSLTTAIIESLSQTQELAIRKFIRKLFKSLKNNGVSSIIISRDRQEFDTAVGLSDCAVFFEPHAIGDRGLSSCTITKVRLSRHNKQVNYIEISKTGVVSVRTEK